MLISGWHMQYQKHDTDIPDSWIHKRYSIEHRSIEGKHFIIVLFYLIKDCIEKIIGLRSLPEVNLHESDPLQKENLKFIFF